MENKENVIEFLTGSHSAGASFTNKKHINRLKQIHAERPEDFKQYIENPDGSVTATFPLKWVKINPGSKEKRELTEEQKEALRERMKKAQAARKKNIDK